MFFHLFFTNRCSTHEPEVTSSLLAAASTQVRRSTSVALLLQTSLSWKHPPDTSIANRRPPLSRLRREPNFSSYYTNKRPSTVRSSAGFFIQSPRFRSSSVAGRSANQRIPMFVSQLSSCFPRPLLRLSETCRTAPVLRLTKVLPPLCTYKYILLFLLRLFLQRSV